MRERANPRLHLTPLRCAAQVEHKPLAYGLFTERSRNAAQNDHTS